jgi:hypothetical protein
MRMVICAASILVASVCMPAAAEIYSCKVNGKTAYQDRPCAAGAAQSIVVPVSIPASAHEQPVQLDEPQRQAAPVQSPQQIQITVQQPTAPPPPARPGSDTLRAARIGNRVLAGMTPKDVLASAGKYSEHHVSSGADAAGQYEVWIFPAKFETFPYSVKFRQGVVVEYSSDDLRYRR